MQFTERVDGWRSVLRLLLVERLADAAHQSVQAVRFLERGEHRCRRYKQCEWVSPDVSELHIVSKVIRDSRNRLSVHIVERGYIACQASSDNM